jgi:hypothetical protein
LKAEEWSTAWGWIQICDSFLPGTTRNAFWAKGNTGGSKMSQLNSKTLFMLMGMAVAVSFIGCSSDSQDGSTIAEEQELTSNDEGFEPEGEPVFPTPEVSSEEGGETSSLIEDDPSEEEETTPEEEETTPEEEETTPEEEETTPEEEETTPEEEETIAGPVDADEDGLDSDEDCDDQDEMIGLPTEYFADEDSDGFGNSGKIQMGCFEPKGYVSNAEDCDDTSSDIHPAALEICDSEGVDENCNGLANDLDSELSDGTLFFIDEDGDGFGASDEISACEAPEGYAGNDSDCDDSNEEVHPGATEICDGINNDCDASTSETNLITIIEESNLFGPNGQADPTMTTYTTQSNPNGARTELSFGKVNSGSFSFAGGDVVVNVCAGTHYVDLDVTGAATIQGMNNSAKLSGSDQGTVITKTGSGELKLINLKVRDGFGTTSATVDLNGSPTQYYDVAGGIYCGKGQLVLDDVLLSSNDANRGGGIFAHDCNVTVKNGSIISSNTADRFGGGVWIRNSTLTLDDTIVMLNEVGPSTNGNSKGGGVFVGNGEVVMTGSIFTSNTATASNGHKGMGGGIAVDESSFSCEGGSGVKGFSANQASYGYGSAISVKGESSTIVSNGCDFGENDGTENPDPDIASDDAQCTWGGSCSSDYRFEWDGDGSQGGITSYEFDHNEDFECYWDSSVSCLGTPDSEYFSCSWKGLVCE